MMEHLLQGLYGVDAPGNIVKWRFVLTELREKDGASEPAAGQEENYESVTAPDNSEPGRVYQELEMSRR